MPILSTTTTTPRISTLTSKCRPSFILALSSRLLVSILPMLVVGSPLLLVFKPLVAVKPLTRMARLLLLDKLLSLAARPLHGDVGAAVELRQELKSSTATYDPPSFLVHLFWAHLQKGSRDNLRHQFRVQRLRPKVFTRYFLFDAINSHPCILSHPCTYLFASSPRVLPSLSWTKEVPRMKSIKVLPLLLPLSLLRLLPEAREGLRRRIFLITWAWINSRTSFWPSTRKFSRTIMVILSSLFVARFASPILHGGVWRRTQRS